MGLEKVPLIMAQYASIGLKPANSSTVAPTEKPSTMEKSVSDSGPWKKGPWGSNWDSPWDSGPWKNKNRRWGKSGPGYGYGPNYGYGPKGKGGYGPQGGYGPGMKGAGPAYGPRPGPNQGSGQSFGFRSNSDGVDFNSNTNRLTPPPPPPPPPPSVVTEGQPK